ncbi:MAG TPA: hypothetical protein PKE69_24765 [Pyrinomonadaceae bacterium]|nr:hypothetical protein [Pyrinomonadaceae bacterium]
MKNLMAKLVIALVVLSGIPDLGLAKTSPLVETITENSTTKFGSFRLSSNSYRIHNIPLNRGSADIILEGDGDTDLDLYVYDDNNNFIGKSECGCDYETISLQIYRSTIFKVKVVNRGDVYNDYTLTVR